MFKLIGFFLGLVFTPAMAITSNSSVCSLNSDDSMNNSDVVLAAGQCLVSANKNYFAIMQSDGNFVVYRGAPDDSERALLWESNTASGANDNSNYAIMQSDGNFVVYKGNSNGSDPKIVEWNSHSTGWFVGGGNFKAPLQVGPPYFAVMQDDGNFVIYEGTSDYIVNNPNYYEGGPVLWATSSNIIVSAKSELGLNSTLDDSARLPTSSPTNTELGDGALSSNTTGTYNTAIGASALGSNKGGFYNTAVGAGALMSNSNNYNTAVGTSALQKNTKGYYNTAIGAFSLNQNTTGIRNTAIGYGALRFNVGPNGGGSKDGDSNTAIGWNALERNTTGLQNTAVGESALTVNTTGNHNTGIGEDVLNKNISGGYNTAIGESALYENGIGNYNVAHGYFALNRAQDNNNIAIGAQAGCVLEQGSNNIYLGNVGVINDSGVIRIGNVTPGNIACPQGSKFVDQSSTFIAGIYGASISGGHQVVVSSEGQLGLLSSSRHVKEEIAPLNPIDDRILKLRPVSFRYAKAKDKNNEIQPLQYGLIAEEVSEIMPELVHFDKDGKPITVNYQFLGPLLLKVMQREHSEIQRQKTLLTMLQTQNDVLRKDLSALQEAVFSNKLARNRYSETFIE